MCIAQTRPSLALALSTHTPSHAVTRPRARAQVFLTPIYLCIAMEFAPGGDMFEYVVKKNGLREDEARWFFQQLIVALDYCHKMVRGGHAVGWRDGAGHVLCPHVRRAARHTAVSERTHTAHSAAW